MDTATNCVQGRLARAVLLPGLWLLASCGADTLVGTAEPDVAAADA